MHGDVPAAIQNLTSLQYLYLDNVHYTPLRQKYCRQRLPNNGKYNYRIVRDEYVLLHPTSTSYILLLTPYLLHPTSTTTASCGTSTSR